MQSKPEILVKLNHLLGNELIAINQFFLHARMYKNWGLEQLNEVDYKRSIKAMKQADDLINRILFLEGLPNLQSLGRLMIGENAPEMLDCDLKLQTQIRVDLLEAISLFEQEKDFLSRELAEEILEHCEEHIDWLETQFGLIEKTGLPNYLQTQMNH